MEKPSQQGSGVAPTGEEKEPAGVNASMVNISLGEGKQGRSATRGEKDSVERKGENPAFKKIFKRLCKKKKKNTALAIRKSRGSTSKDDEVNRKRFIGRKTDKLQNIQMARAFFCRKKGPFRIFQGSAILSD